MKEQFLEGGRVVNTFGVRGEVKIAPWCDSAEFLQQFKTLYIDGAPLTVESARPHKGMLLTKFRGVDDVNAAMELKNRVVRFDRAEAALPEGAFFFADLIGAWVVDEQGAEVGELTEIVDLPAGNVYTVRSPDGAEHSIPAVPAFVLDTDVDGGVVKVRLIEGM